MRLFTLILIFSVIVSCNDKKQKAPPQEPDSIQQEYLKMGGEVSKQAQGVLLKNVSQAMKKGGPGYAIEFCNIKALPLMDSLSKLHNCQIKRIALKYRNPVDKPQTGKEIEQLNQYQKTFEKEESLEPIVHIFEDRIEYYKPIMLGKPACLKCHGDTDKHIAQETLKKIAERYPNDLATGFVLKDFRGAWKITFSRTE
jgi:hypothetical protein